MCCDTERAKHEKVEASRRQAEEAAQAKRLKENEDRRAAQLSDPAWQDWAIARVCPDEARPFLRETGGFRYCPTCDGVGAGCVACDGVERQFILDAVRDAIWWKKDRPDVRDLRDAVERAEAAKRNAGDPKALTEDAVEAAFQPALDAEYQRQFPDGPKPMLSFSRTDSTSMALLGAFMGSVKRAISSGDGMDEIELAAETVRKVQASGIGPDAVNLIVR